MDAEHTQFSFIVGTSHFKRLPYCILVTVGSQCSGCNYRRLWGGGILCQGVGVLVFGFFKKFIWKWRKISE